MLELGSVIVIALILLAAIWPDIQSLHRVEQTMSTELEKLPGVHWNPYSHRARRTLGREYVTRGGDPQMVEIYEAASRHIFIAVIVWLLLSGTAIAIIRYFKRMTAH